MIKYKILKSPFKLKKKLIKNFSFNDYQSKGNSRKIFKIKERLFSLNSLSLLSKSKFNKNNNHNKNINLLPTISHNNKINLEAYDNFPNKSLDNQIYLSMILKKKIQLNLKALKILKIIKNKNYH